MAERRRQGKQLLSRQQKRLEPTHCKLFRHGASVLPGQPSPSRVQRLTVRCTVGKTHKQLVTDKRPVQWIYTQFSGVIRCPADRSASPRSRVGVAYTHVVHV